MIYRYGICQSLTAPCTAGILNSIKDNIPEGLHKDLYYTLFESHLTYGITVWGSVRNNKLETLFKKRKKCLRILFGDKEAYIAKSKTCARAREFNHQYLDADFYKREHSKPLFNRQSIIYSMKLSIINI